MHIINALILLTEASNDNRILWKDFGSDFKLVFTSVQLENKAISTENLRSNQEAISEFQTKGSGSKFSSWFCISFC